MRPRTTLPSCSRMVARESQPRSVHAMLIMVAYVRSGDLDLPALSGTGSFVTLLSTLSPESRHKLCARRLQACHEDFAAARRAGAVGSISAQKAARCSELRVGHRLESLLTERETGPTPENFSEEWPPRRAHARKYDVQPPRSRVVLRQICHSATKKPVIDPLCRHRNSCAAGRAPCGPLLSSIRWSGVTPSGLPNRVSDACMP